MVYKFFTVIFVTLFISTVLCIGSVGPCEQKNNSLCVFANGQQINLSPIQNVANNFTMYTNKIVAFFYQPVVDLPVNSSNFTVEKAGIWMFVPAVPAVVDLNGLEVLQGKVNGTFTSIASVSTAKFLVPDFDLVFSQNEFQIEYNKDISNTSEKTIVVIKCEPEADPNNFVLAEKYDIPPEYKHGLTLTSFCPFLSSPMSSGVSTGTNLLVIFFFLSLIYLLGGMLVNKFLRGAGGLEMIPNIDFWRELPSLVKDGFVFAVSLGRARPQTYESI